MCTRRNRIARTSTNGKGNLSSHALARRYDQWELDFNGEFCRDNLNCIRERVSQAAAGLYTSYLQTPNFFRHMPIFRQKDNQDPKSTVQNITSSFLEELTQPFPTWEH